MRDCLSPGAAPGSANDIAVYYSCITITVDSYQNDIQIKSQGVYPLIGCHM